MAHWSDTLTENGSSNFGERFHFKEIKWKKEEDTPNILLVHLCAYGMCMCTHVCTHTCIHYTYHTKNSNV